MRRLLGVVAVWVLAGAAMAGPVALDVKDFGAKADGVTDDTAAFQKAMDEAGKAGGRVFVPAGRYLIAGNLRVPEAVVLEGVFKAPGRTIYNEGRLEKEKGSILLTTAGKGNENGEPFITLNRSSQITGMIVYYPEQTFPVVPFPWCVRGHGDNCTITDVLLINPYKAVDFGTFPAGRHYINGLYAQALKTGLFIDKCFDVGRVENVHFWPFWRGSDELREWMQANSTAFVIGRTDWEYMTNCFAIWYAVGFHFVEGEKDGPGNAVLTQCGSDIGPLAVKVDAVQSHAGVSFVNSQFMAGVDVADTNAGPVKFTACGFWGWGKTDTHARLRGTGQTTFVNCHFNSWGQVRNDAAAIVADGGGLTLSACEFTDPERSKAHVVLNEEVETAVIMGNRFRTPPRIVNHSEGQVEVGMNVGGGRPGLMSAIEAGDQRKLAELWERRLARGGIEGSSVVSRLASAAVLDEKRTAPLRAKLLESVAAGKADDPAVGTFVRRAKDELRLAKGETPERPVLVATRVAEGPRVDGKLDDAAWAKARPVTFGSPETEARVVCDHEAIYFAARVREPAIGKLKSAEAGRDGRVWEDDSVEFFLAPRRVTHRYMQLILNATGGVYDGIGTERGTSATLWNTKAEVKATRGAEEWVVEMRLPWADVGATPAPGDVWACDVRRWRYAGGRQDQTGWAGAPQGGPTHHPEAFGFLRFE